jgi:hypothetical protein
MAEEQYAFIRSSSYNGDTPHGEKLRGLWPRAVAVGADYYIIQYSSAQKDALIALSESVGFPYRS